MSSRLLRWLRGIAQCSRGLDLACTVLFVTVFVVGIFRGLYDTCMLRTGKFCVFFIYIFLNLISLC